MARYEVRMQRTVRESRTVIVEAASEAAAKRRALTMVRRGSGVKPGENEEDEGDWTPWDFRRPTIEAVEPK